MGKGKVWCPYVLLKYDVIVTTMELGKVMVGHSNLTPPPPMPTYGYQRLGWPESDIVKDLVFSGSPVLLLKEKKNT